MSVGYLTDAKDWSRALDGADSIAALQAVCADWMPYVPDAVAVAGKMDAAAFDRWRVGLAKERKRREWRGQMEWVEEFGELVLPTNLLQAAMVAEQYKTPLGVALIQMENAGVLKLTPAGRASNSEETQ